MVGEGGGGTPWDSMAYDPDLDLLYFGTGNGVAVEPQPALARRRRQSLSLLDRRAASQRPANYAWHYQTTPGDDLGLHRHRSTSSSPTSTIDGEHAQGADAGAEERLLLCASTATNGKLISAETLHDRSPGPSGVDLKTGRPIENPGARYHRQDALGRRSRVRIGAHNWQPMSFNPETGLVYIPAIDGNFIYAQQHAMATSPAPGTSAISRSSATIVMGAIERPDAGAREGYHPRLGSGGAEDGVAGRRWAAPGTAAC